MFIAQTIWTEQVFPLNEQDKTNKVVWCAVFTAYLKSTEEPVYLPPGYEVCEVTRMSGTI